MIGIFGGTFDPIHFGHLRLALEIYENYALDEIRFIPCKIPVHKSVKSEAIHRVAMLKLAIENQPGFVLDQREIVRETPSYMLETLTSLKHDFPKQTFGLIIGSDTLMRFRSWHAWEEILTLARLLVVPRTIKSIPIKKLPKKIQSAMTMCPVTTLPISSTLIYQLLQKKKSIRYLVPEKVEMYLQRKQLYAKSFIKVEQQ